MDVFEPKDIRFLQERTNSSGAGGLSVNIGPVPAGKFWTVTLARGSNSVGAGGENQVIWFSVRRPNGNYFPVTRPVQQVVDSTVSQFFPMLTEGLELRLNEGEMLFFFRAAATAGSTITINAVFIESDVPLYTYEEPQIALKSKRILSSIRSEISRGRAGSAPPVARLVDRGSREPRER